MADITGTSGNDNLTGTGDDDLITGGVGDDTIEGGTGNDTLIGDGGSAGGTGSSGTTFGDGPGSTGRGYERIRAQSEFDTFDFTTDAFFLGNDIPLLARPGYNGPAGPDGDYRALDGVTFSQDGAGTDRSFGLEELSLTGGSRSYVGVIDINRSDLYGENTSVSSSLTGGPQDLVMVNDGHVRFTMNDGTEFPLIQMKFIRDEDGNTYMVPGDGASPGAFNSFRNLLATNDSGIASFQITDVDDVTNGIIVIGGDWADGQFADITDPPAGDSFDDVLCGDEGDDIIYGDGGDSATAAGFGVAGGLLDPEERVDGTLYGRFPGSVYDGNFDFSSDAFYLGDDIGVLDGGNRNELRGQTFTQDGSGNTRVAELVDIDFTGAQKSFVGLATVQRTALHRANDQFSASNGDGFQDVVIVNDVDVTFTMNDGSVFQHIRMQFLRGEDGKTYLLADDHPQQGTFNSIRTTVYRNDSGIESITIQSSSGNINGINPIVGNWAAGQFKVTQDGEGGDDIIKGGAGSDTMFGEGGDDTFVVESAADGAGDIVVGGNGPDQNTDNDVLDLRGAGVVTIDAVADDNDAGAQSGTVTFNNGETLTFEGIEEILQDEPALTIEPAPGTPIDPATGNPLTAENGEPAQIVISRNTPTDEPLEVFLTDGDPSETDAPVSVIIPAGETSVTVDIPSVDDPIVDGDQVSVITATAPGFAPAEQPVTVADDDDLTLTIEPGPNQPVDGNGNPVTQENGDPVELVITRNGPTDEPLVVTLNDGDPTETDSPTTVTIPAGEDSVTVLVDPVDDPIVDGDQTVPVTASAPGYPTTAQDVTVEDDDTPALTIEPGPNTPIDPATGLPVTQENGEPVELVVTRNTPTDEDLVVTIQNGDPSETNPPITVTIPAGEESVSFLVDPVDDPIVDGDQTSPITATAPGFAPDTQDVLVEDDDEPALTIEPAPGTPIDPATGNPLTAENGEPAQIVISRNTPTDEPLEVFLTDGDPSETDAPVSVIIPAGETSVTVDIPSVDDPIVDGDQVSVITATAPGFAPAEQPVTVADDDDLTLTIEPGPNQPVDGNGNPVTQENGDPVELVITRNGPTDEPLVVTLNDGDPTETDSPTTVTIPAGEDSVTVLVDPVDDPIVDGDQTVPVTASAPGYPTTAQDVTVEDDDTPALTIEPGPNTPIDPATGLPVTQENGEPVELVVTRNTPTDEDLVVTIQNGDPSETNPPITVTIPAGEESVSFLVDPVDDPIVDGDQTSPITATAPGFAPDTQDVLVEDDDEPALTIEPAPGTPIDPATGNPLTAENGEPAQIVISRNTPTDEPLEVFLTDGDPSETDAPVSVIIPAGETSVTVDIPSVDDPIVDGDQVSVITATAPGFAPAEQPVTVADDDDLTLTIEPGPNQPVDGNGNPVTQENGDPVELVITRNGPTDEPLVVTLNDGDPTETDSPTTVTIPAGEDSVTVLVDPVDDPIVDGDQTVPVTASAPGYPTTAQDVTVEDDDTPALTIEPGPNTPIDPATGLPVTQENGEPVELVVTRNTPTDEDLVVTIQNGDPSETNPPITVTIPAGEESVSFLVDPVDDPIVDGDQTSPITATAPGFAPDTQDVLVEDDDEPALTIEPAPGTPIDPATGNPLTAENGEPAQIVISRNTPTDEPLEVFLTDGDPSETDAPVSVIIPAGETSVTVDIPSVDDPIVDGDQVSVITATAPGFAPAEQPVTVADDDDLTLTIEPGPNQPVDGNGNPVTQENGDPVELVITRNGPTDEPLVVTLNDGDPTETDSPTTVTIPAGEDSVTVLVDPVDDPIVDGDQTVPVTASAPGYPTTAQDVTVEDDDTPALTIEPGPNTPIDPATGLPVTQENGEPVELVVTRNTPTDEDLVVTIQNGDPSETNPPITVTIPAGEESVSFLVDPVDDPIVDGDQTSPITATAPGFAPDTQDVLVEDDDGGKTGDISGRAFSDENGDGLSNDDFGGGPSMGVPFVLVRLLDENGVQVGFTQTDINGDYSFTNVDSGTYTVEFRELGGGDPATKLTTQDAFGNAFDDIDSDAAEIAPGIYQASVSVVANLVTPDISIGFAPDLPPLPTDDDAAMVCADELLVVDVLANDGEAGSGPLTITEVNGHAISEGQSITTAAGTVVTLTGGQLVIDGDAAYAHLDIGESANEVITYTATDGVLTGTADLDVTFKGDANSVASIDAALKANGGTNAFFFVEPVSVADFDDAYTLHLMGTQPEDVVGSGTYMAAYCIDGELPIELGLFTTGTLTVLTEENAAAASGNINTDNVDALSWLLNEQFEFKDNGDGTGDTYTDFEIQEAIWTLMNGDTFFINEFTNPELTDNNNGVRDGAEIGTVDNINEIVLAALSHGEGFVAQDGDIVGLIIDPFDPSNQEQPFVIAVNYDDIDCLC